MMQLRITWDAPSDISEWNSLAEANSNLLQSTYYDPVECSGGSRPVYFECREEEKLVAGVKFFFGQAKHRLIVSLSRSLVQFGEMIYSTGELGKYKLFIEEGLLNFIRKEKIVVYKSSGYYGGAELLFHFEKKKLKQYSMNLVHFDLIKSEKELWSSIYPTHRTKINKAGRLNLTIENSDNEMKWLDLIKESFRDYPDKKPDDSYLLNQYRGLHQVGLARIYECRNGTAVYSSALIHEFGKYAYFAFGGNRRDRIGASHYFHWRMALHYKSLGYERYCLGMISNNSEWANKKFREGLSLFKKHFGGNESTNVMNLQILRPFHHFAFKQMLKIRNRV